MPTPPQPLIAAQELARLNNENQAVHRAYRSHRRQRRWLKAKSPLPEITRDALDRQAAERETRPVRAVGFFLPALLQPPAP